MESTEFHKRLASYRTQLGLNQLELAKKIGVAVSTYRDWENGVRIQGHENFIKLSTALEVPLGQLMAGMPVNRKIIDDINYIIQGLEELKKDVLSLL